LIIQCDSGHKNADLIACARYRIYDELVKPLEKRKTRQCITHTLFVIYLPPQVTDSTFVGFQGDPWISSHIDELMPTSIAPQDAVMTSISEVFIGDYLRPLLGEVVEDEDKSFEENSSTSSEDQAQGEKSDIEVEDQEFELASSSDSLHKPISIQAIEEFQEQSSPIQSEVMPIPQNSQTQINTEDVLVMDIEDISHNEYETTSDQSDEGSLMQHLNSSDSNDSIVEQNLLASKSTEELQGILEVEAVHSDNLSQTPTMIHDISIQEADSETLGSREESGEEKEADVISNGSEQYIASYTVSAPTEYIIASPSDTSIKPKILPRQHPIAQCKRLYGSIQSAVSKTEDASNVRSTVRVKRLIKLIPKDPEQSDLSKLITTTSHLIQLTFSRAFELLRDPDNAYLPTSSGKGG
jgi:hypothetical protein